MEGAKVWSMIDLWCIVCMRRNGGKRFRHAECRSCRCNFCTWMFWNLAFASDSDLSTFATVDTFVAICRENTNRYRHLDNCKSTLFCCLKRNSVSLQKNACIIRMATMASPTLNWCPTILSTSSMDCAFMENAEKNADFGSRTGFRLFTKSGMNQYFEANYNTLSNFKIFPCCELRHI